MFSTRQILSATNANEVIVGVSCGKDATVVLDLCRRQFSRIVGYFLYYVPALEFQEKYLSFLERRFGIEIIRLPHFELSKMLKTATYRPHTKITASCEKITIKDILAEVRARTGVEWVATGEKMIDSLQRRGMISRCSGVDAKTKKIYPLASWNNAEVFTHLRRHGISLPPDYAMFGRSFGALRGPELIKIKEKFPKDFDRIKEFFPYVEATTKREEFFRRQ